MNSITRALAFTALPKEPSLPLSLEILEGKIEFTDVVMKYTPTSNPSLNGFTLKIKSGQKVAFVGRSGAGKSSVLNALLQLYPLSGLITIDGVNLSKVSLESLRRQISVIPQTPFLFHGSVRKNIDPFNRVE